MADHPEDVVDPWLQLLVLDGLRVIFQEIDRPDLAELICTIYESWTHVMGTDFSDNPDALRFERHFAEASGFVQGRKLERLFQETTEATQKKESDPDAIATNIAELVVKGMGPFPKATRAEIERGFEASLGDLWRKRLPDGVKQLIVEAEWLRGLIEKGDGTDYGPAAVQLGRAVEALLRNLSASDFTLSTFCTMLSNRDRARVGFLRKEAPLSKLASMVEHVARERNAAAHGDPRPYRPTSLSKMARMQELVIGSPGEEGLLALLTRYRKS